MIPPALTRFAARSAAAAVLLLSALGAGCDRPPDESWLRFLGFAEPGTETTIATLRGKLRDDATDVADARFLNRSAGVSTGAPGSGILVYRARVQYRMARLSPPAAEYELTLYLPSAASADDNDNSSGGGETATLSGFPLATAALKRWLIETRAFDDERKTPTADLTAVVTFFAVTDEGDELQTSGGVSLSLSTER